MDKAQITVLRLGGQPPPTQPQASPGMPAIPGVPPELQAMGQQALQGLQGVLPPGVIPPGLIPGMPPPAAPAPPPPMFKGFVIQAQMPLSDDRLRNEILDVFGAESSFNDQRGNCFAPGMGVSISRPNGPPVDLLISLSCNQAMGDGFRWPYPVNGFTRESHDRLSKVYEKLWGPVPPGA
jgi:hypothetical protein